MTIEAPAAARTGKIDLGSGQAQHVDLWRKLKLRRELLALADPGPAYVPFLGEGDIALELYADRAVYGVELDPLVAATASARLAGSIVVAGDAEVWHFTEADPPPFAVADFDAFANPYRSIEAFWRGAPKAGRLVLFGTDGMRLATVKSRSRMYGSLPAGKLVSGTFAEKRHQSNVWWIGFVRPYLVELFAPRLIIRELKYQRGTMLYWGVVLADPDQAPEWTAQELAGARAVLAGIPSRVATADASGPAELDASPLETSDGSRRDPSDASRGDDQDPSIEASIAKVEKALLEAAESGNVPAARFWLEHKGGPIWQKTNAAEAQLEHLTRGRRRR